MTIGALMRRATPPLLALDLILLGLFLFLQMHPQKADGRQIALADPLTIEGAHLVRPQQRCAILHYTAKYCEYCRHEAPVWDAVKAKSQQMGCRAFTFAPNAAEVPDRTLKAELGLFVAPPFAKTFASIRTPTTTLIDQSGRVTWEKVGELLPSDADALLHRAETMGK